MNSHVTTIERFILDQEDRYPEATGELSNLLYDICLAAKIIAASIRRAGLVNILGTAGIQNIQGEEQQKLDIFANETLKNCLKHTGRVCVMGSEEDDDIIPVPPEYPVGKYAVLFDPLDGSSNIDVNSAVGTIFSIYRRVSMHGRGTSADVLQPGCKQVASGYIMYGSSTMLVYTTGQGVHGFTLDPTIGEFLLSHPKITTPRVGKYYSVNESNFPRWDKGMQTAVRGLKGDMTLRDGPRRSDAKEQPLHGLAGGRFSPQPRRRRHFPLSGRQQESAGKAPAAVRGKPHGVPGRAGRGVGHRWGQPDPRYHAGAAAPADAPGDRLEGRRGLRGRHTAAGGHALQRSRFAAGVVKTVYGPEDWTGDPAGDLGRPGEFPFTRGPYPNMYTGRLWTMRQYAGFGTAQETNQRFRQLLAAGQVGLSTAFDLPTQMGYDSDHPMAQGEVGRVGVAIDTVEDIKTLFREIPLDRVSTSMTINATAAILLAMYVVAGEEQQVPRSKLTGTVQNDVLKEYIARGTYIYPAGPSLRLVADIFRFVADEEMSFNPISISGYHMREAGATAVQEVGFTLANALEYVRVAVAAGLSIDSFGPRLSFFFASHNNLLEEAAKFRAARRLWARLVRERFGAGDATARMRFHTQTGGVTLQAQQPLNNVVRVTVQALAAVLGGTQSLHTNGYDEALSLPSSESATLALRTQQILGFESGVSDVVDPLAGQLLRRGAHRFDRDRCPRADRHSGWIGGRRSRRSSRASSRRQSPGVPMRSRRPRSRVSG